MSNQWLLIFFVLFALILSLVDAKTYVSNRRFGQSVGCPRQRLNNGRVKLRGRGYIVKFICNPTHELIGKRFSTCLQGKWTDPTPICVASGCSSVTLVNGNVDSYHQSAYLRFNCSAGYVLDGSSSIYCDGQDWNSTAPTCIVANKSPPLSCDFEHDDICGWTSPEEHDFTWLRNNFATPSGHVGTGPSYDHTLGAGRDGYYMYIEGSSPRKENDTARLISPVYNPTNSNGCFSFWYHMYGATTGFLLVYVKSESQKVEDLKPSFYKAGNQGNRWRRGSVVVPPLLENFQIVIVGIRGVSYVSDTAIDDVSLTKNYTYCNVEQDDDVTTEHATTREITTIRLPESTFPPTTSSSITTYSSTSSPTTTSLPITSPPTTTSPSTTTTNPTTTIFPSTTEFETASPSTTTTTTTTLPPPPSPPSPPPPPPPPPPTTTTIKIVTRPLTTQLTTKPTTPSAKSPKFTVKFHETLPPTPLFPRQWTTTSSEQVQKPEKHKDEISSDNLPIGGAVAIIIVGIILLAGIGGGIYWSRRRRELAREKLTDDSDVRYLKDDDIQFDFTEAKPDEETNFIN